MKRWQKIAVIGGALFAVGMFAFLRSRRHIEVDEESAGGTTIWILEDDEPRRIVPNEKPDLDVIYNDSVLVDMENNINSIKEEYDDLTQSYITFTQDLIEENECTLVRITKEEFDQEDDYEPHSATWYPASNVLAGFDGDNDIIAFDLLGWSKAIESLSFDDDEPGYFKDKDALGKYVINVSDREYGKPQEIWEYK